MLKEYQREYDPKKETQLITKILIQMISDSECVPLFYLVTPDFYNTDVIDAIEDKINKSMLFWELPVKQ